eukprot:gene25876-11547_t
MLRKPASSAAFPRVKVAAIRKSVLPLHSQAHAFRQVSQVATLNEVEELTDLVVNGRGSFDELESRRVSNQEASSSNGSQGSGQGSSRRTRVLPVKEPAPHQNGPPSKPSESALNSSFTVVSSNIMYSLGDEPTTNATAGTDAQRTDTPRSITPTAKAANAFPRSTTNPQPSSRLSAALSALEAVAPVVDSSTSSTSSSWTMSAPRATAPQKIETTPARSKHERCTYTPTLLTQISFAINLQTLDKLHSKKMSEIRSHHLVAMIKRYAVLVHAAGNPSLDQLGSRAQDLWCSLCEMASVLSPSFTVRETSDILHAVVVVFQNCAPSGKPDADGAGSKGAKAGKGSNKTRNGKKEKIKSMESSPSINTIVDMKKINKTESSPSISTSDDLEKIKSIESSPHTNTSTEKIKSMESSPSISTSVALAWSGDIMKAVYAEQDSSRPSIRPFSRPRLPRVVDDLVKLLTFHVQARLNDLDLKPVDFACLAVSLGRLGKTFRPSPEWSASFFAASKPHLPDFEKKDILTLAYGLGRLCPKEMPQEWAWEFYLMTQRQLKNLTLREMTLVLNAAAHLPVRPPGLWIQEVMHRVTEMFDHFDAPAYSLTLHAIGLLSYIPPRSWVEEFMDSCATIINDFSLEDLFLLLRGCAMIKLKTELSLLLRGCAMMKLDPGEEWLDELYFQSRTKLIHAGGPQLAEIGYALTSLNLMPPKYWIHEFTQALQQRMPLAGSSVREQRVALAQHDLQQRIPLLGSSIHAQEAALALQHFRVVDLEGWCVRLDVGVLEEKPDLDVEEDEAAVSMDEWFATDSAESIEGSF